MTAGAVNSPAIIKQATRVKENQLRETYVPLSTPHIKSLTTQQGDIFIVDDGIGNLTVHFGEIL